VGKEGIVEANRDEVAYDHTDSTTAQHAGPGIILLTDAMQLLYKDRRAEKLCQDIIRCQNGKTALGVLPPAVASLVDHIRKLLTVRTDQKDWEHVQLRRLVPTRHSAVLLCGTALVDQINAGNRILIVMHETGITEWQDQVILRAKERFQLTPRETTVVEHLLKGWTNKEIANAMRLSEQTVKEHFKHIFDKTRATTRTGILMQVVHSGLRRDPAPFSPEMVVPLRTSVPIELMASA
jgi:DNA-binding CsgD family transcriptional regulator